MNNVLFLIAIIISLTYASCPETLCDCQWGTPSFKIPAIEVNVGSVTISVCDVLPDAVVNFYQDELLTFADGIVTIPDMIEEYKGLVEAEAAELAKQVRLQEVLEGLQGIGEVAEFFSDGKFLGAVESVVDGLDDLKDIVEVGVLVPVKLVQIFPNLLNDINPDDIGDSIREKGEAFLYWFTDAVMNTANNLGGDSCAHCLVDNLNNGVISFDIGVDTGPGLTLSVIFRSTRALECLVNSFGELAIVLSDSIPDILQDGFEGIGAGLVTSAQAVVDASDAVRGSDFCNMSFGIEKVDFDGNTGLEVLDEFIDQVEKFVNFVGADGPFASIMNKMTDGICEAAALDGFADFAVSLEDFFNTVSFSGIEDKIMKGLFSVINKMTEGLAAYRLLDFNIDTSSCNPNNRACALAIEYGVDYVSCVQDVMESKALSFSMGISFGEHWAPPSVTGFGAGFTCSHLDCVKCVFGLNGDANLASSIAFLSTEIFSLSNTENGANSVCETVQSCVGGTWDSEACACRCNSGFISDSGNCATCPTFNGKICNDNGACYMEEDGPACCCLGGLTSSDCT